MMDYKRITDHIDRHWELVEVYGKTILKISNSSSDHEIISLDKKYLLWRDTRYGMIYHFEMECEFY